MGLRYIHCHLSWILNLDHSTGFLMSAFKHALLVFLLKTMQRKLNKNFPLTLEPYKILQSFLPFLFHSQSFLNAYLDLIHHSLPSIHSKPLKPGFHTRHFSKIVLYIVTKIPLKFLSPMGTFQIFPYLTFQQKLTLLNFPFWKGLLIVLIYC